MDPFATLGLERKYELDLRAAEKTHRELSRALHPDRHAAAGASERRLALSRAVEVNEAWRVVRDPVRRAEALFALAGVATGEAREPKASPAFLMDVMEQRELLAEAKAKKDRAKVEGLASDIAARQAEVEATLAKAFDEATGDGSRLLALVGKLGELRYYRRFLEEASAVLDALDEAS